MQNKVFEASGHCEKFTDLMCKNEATKAFYRADHLLENHLEKMMDEDKNMSAEKRHELLRIMAQVSLREAKRERLSLIFVFCLSLSVGG